MVFGNVYGRGPMSRWRSRAEQRSKIEQAGRLDLIDDDLDRNDADHSQMREDANAAIAQLAKEVSGVKAVLVGILISLSTASVLLAANLVLQKG